MQRVKCAFLCQLLPLLLEALSCPDQAVQLSTLSCLQPVLLEPPAALRNQLEALFSRLLALATSPAMVPHVTAHCRERLHLILVNLTALA